MNKKIAFAIFIITLAVNLLCASARLKPAIYPDTLSYTQVEQQIVHGENWDLEVRTPGYPLFLAIVDKLGPPELIVIIQSIIAALAAVTAWRLMSYVFRSELWSAVIIIALMTEYGISSWHGIILTESLSISLLIFWIYCQLVSLEVIGFIRWQKYFRWIALILDITLIMIKPAFIYLAILWYLALLILEYQKLLKLPSLRILVTNIIIVGLVVIGYSAMIQRRYGHFELTMVTRINHLGNVITLGLVRADSCEQKPCTALAAAGVAIASDPIKDNNGPYTIMSELSKEFPNVTTSEIVDQVNNALVVSPVSLVLRESTRFIYIFFEPIWYRQHLQTDWFNPAGMLLLSLVYRVYSRLIEFILTLFRPLTVIWTMWWLWTHLRTKNWSTEAWIRFVLFFVVVYNAGVNVYGGYADLKRLMSPTAVEINILTILFIADMLYLFKPSFKPRLQHQ